MAAEKLVRQTFPVGALGCNCTIVSCPETREALVIDPGDEAEAILSALARDGVTAVKLIHTHAHFDHVMATGEVAARTGAAVLLHADDRWLYDHAVMQTEAFGVRRSDGKPWQPPPPPTHELRGDEAIPFGHQETRALHAPDIRPARSASTSSEAPRRRSCSRATPCFAARSGGRICRADRRRRSESRSRNGC